MQRCDNTSSSYFRAAVNVVFVKLLMVHFPIQTRLVCGSNPRQGKLFVFLDSLLVRVLLLHQLLRRYRPRLRWLRGRRCKLPLHCITNF